MKEGRENHLYKSSGLSHVVLENVQVARCPACGEYTVSLPRVLELHQMLAQTLLDKPEKLTPEEIRYLRTWLALSGAELAARLGVSAETLSRWENGQKPMGLVSERLLRVLVALAAQALSYPETLWQVATQKPAPLRARFRADKKGRWLLSKAA
jgi:putative zinc finger/helix-turn-helix YgiT family protein